MHRRVQSPVIGITCEAISKRRDFADYELLCDHRYALAVKSAGGHPVLIPIAHRKSVLRRYLEGIDGLVIVGGDDVNPRLYGEKPFRTTKIIFERRTAFESWLYRAGKKRRLPLLGICYGMQLINVLEGGTLYQEVPRRRQGPRVDHRGRRGGSHRIRFIPRTRLGRLLGVPSALVATEHHQAVRDLAPGFVPSAVAADGVIEAIENPSLRHILSVQWHPERFPNSEITERLFGTFVRLCRKFRRAQESISRR